MVSVTFPESTAIEMSQIAEKFSCKMPLALNAAVGLVAQTGLH
jgi:hypothetical protein